MAKKLISTALVGLLLSAGAALAQPEDRAHRDHPGDHGGPPPAPPAPRGAPAAAPAAAPNHAPPAALDRRDRVDNRPSAGRQAAPQAQPAPRAAFRGAPGPAIAMHGPAGPHNFASFHRNFSSPHRFRAAAYHRPRGWYAHRWTFGEVLPALFWAPDYWIDDYVDYGLMPPPPGTVWVRDGSDALLITRDDGEIIQVDYDVFY